MEIFTENFKSSPYWWEKAPRPKIEIKKVPEKIDVAIIGSGYTGLCAALTLAKAGCEVVVFDAEDAGWGCSSRNGGQVSTSIKPGFRKLCGQFGEAAAIKIIKEGQNSLDWLKDFIAREKIDCSIKVPGRFFAAHSQREFDLLAANLKAQPASLEVKAKLVTRSEQRKELGTDIYHGGAVFKSHASLDPALYHLALLEKVFKAGVTVITNCRVKKIRKHNAEFSLDTQLGSFNANKVIVGTNGYTGQLTPWLSRRVIPIGSYMIATDVLDDDLINELMPTDRVISDTRKVVYYYRPSPDRRRIIFGGRVTTGEVDVKRSGALLRRDLVGIFPELKNVKVSHSWMGFVAYTFDELPHIGEYEGIHYAMGCCGSGVGMASYLGTRVAEQVLGRKEGDTAFDKLTFETRPFYTGKPWFLPATVAYYRWRDGTDQGNKTSVV